MFIEASPANYRHTPTVLINTDQIVSVKCMPQGMIEYRVTMSNGKEFDISNEDAKLQLRLRTGIDDKPKAPNPSVQFSAQEG